MSGMGFSSDWLDLRAPADEAVMLQAQDLSQAALERLRQVRASGAERQPV